MKYFKFLFTAVLCAVILVSCDNSSDPDDNPDDGTSDYYPSKIIVTADGVSNTADLHYTDGILTSIDFQYSQASGIILTTTIQYDANGHLASLKSDNSGDIIYTFSGNLLDKVIDYDWEGAEDYTYDAAGRLIQVDEYWDVIIEEDESHDIYYVNYFDGTNNIKSIDLYEEDYSNPGEMLLYVKTEYGYNSDNKVKTITYIYTDDDDDDNEILNFTYDLQNRLATLKGGPSNGDNEVEIYLIYNDKYMTSANLILEGEELLFEFEWEKGKTNYKSFLKEKLSYENYEMNFISDELNLIIGIMEF